MGDAGKATANGDFTLNHSFSSCCDPERTASASFPCACWRCVSTANSANFNPETASLDDHGFLANSPTISTNAATGTSHLMYARRGAKAQVGRSESICGTLSTDTPRRSNGPQ